MLMKQAPPIPKIYAKKSTPGRLHKKSDQGYMAVLTQSLKKIEAELAKSSF